MRGSNKNEVNINNVDGIKLGKFAELNQEGVTVGYDFEERVNDLKEKYKGSNDFDYETIIKLENEYNTLLTTNADHTRRRSEILEMRHRLLDRMQNKPIKYKIDNNAKDMYIDTGRDKCIVYYDGKVFYINLKGLKSTDIVEIISSKFGGFKNKNVFTDKNGCGTAIADVFDDKNIQYANIKILR